MTKFYYERMRLSKLHVCMKSFVLLLFSIFGMTLSQAQVSAYTFSQSNGSFTDISGGTVLGTATGNATATNLNSNVYPIALPFDFTFNGVNYTTGTNINASTNGFITFGATPPTATTTTPISGTVAYEGAVAAFGGDLSSYFDITGKTGEMRWEVLGTAPNRELVIQWQNFRPNSSTSTTAVYGFSFQIKLYETTNAVSVVYNAGGYLAGGTTAISGTRQIGLRGATNADFNNRLSAATVNFDASTIGTANSSSQAYNTLTTPPGMPAYGLTYTWTPSTCFAPASPFIIATTTNSANVDWNAPSTAPANGYDLYFSTSNVAPDATTVLDVSNSLSIAPGVTEATIPGLTDATTYYVWIRSKCSASEFSNWSSANTFVTDCLSMTYLAENFDSYGTGNIVPTCWYRMSGTGNQTITTTDPASGTRNLYQYTATTATPIIVVLPHFSNINAGTHQFRFKARVTAAPGTLEVGYVTNVNDAASFVLLQSLTINNTVYTTPDAEYIVYVPASVPANARLAVKTQNDAKAYYWDDVFWEPAPTCGLPANFQNAGQTVNSGTVQWDAPAISTPVSYTVYYSTSATAPDASTVLDATNSVTVPSTSLSATINGLASATMYYAWIRTNCAGSDVSGWSSSVFFVTLCNPFTVPYSENFDTTSVGSSSNNNAPTCWKYLEPSGWGGYGYVSSSTGQFSSAPNGYYIYSSDAAGGGMLVSPPTSNLMNGLNRVRFKANAGGANYNVQVGTLSNPNDPTTFTSLATIALGATNVWGDYTVYIPTGTDQYFAFKHPGQTGTGTSVRFDDIFFEVTPTCVEPSNFAISGQSANSISMQWTPPAVSTPTSYTIYYSTTNVAPDGSTVLDGTNSLTVPASATTATISPLNPSTTYYFWIRSNCSATDQSIWSSNISGYTGYCIPATGATQTRWLESVTTTGGNTNLNYINPSYVAYVDNTAVSFSTYPSGMINYSMDASTTSNTYYYIWVDWNNDMDFEDAGEKVLGTGSIAVATGTLTIPSTTPLGSYRVRLAAATVSTIGACGTPANGNYVDFTLDIVAPPSCVPPTSFAVTGFTDTNANFSWTPSITPPNNGYEYYYSTTNSAPTAAVAASGTFTGGSAATSGIIPGLTPSTTYYVWIRSACSGTDSVWTGPLTFTTACPSVAAPFTESFSSGTLPSCWKSVNPTTSSTSANVFWKFGTGIDYGATNNGKTAGTYAWVDASSPYANEHTVQLYSPLINLTGLAAPAVQFEWYKNHLTSAGTLPAYDNNKLIVEINSGSGWVTIFADSSNASNLRIIPIPLGASYVNTTIQLRFTVDKDVAGNGYFYDDMLIDEVKVLEASNLGTSDTISDAKEFRVYPNPFTDFITISDERDVTKVTVIDVSGRLVRMIDNPSSKINLSELKSGMYILKLDYKDGSSKSAKVIKK